MVFLWYTVLYTIIHCYTLLYIIIHYYTLLYITIHYFTLLYITIHYYTLLYIIIHYYTLLYIIIHYYTLLYIIIHYYTLLYNIIYYYILLYLIMSDYILLCLIISYYISLLSSIIGTVTQTLTNLVDGPIRQVSCWTSSHRSHHDFARRLGYSSAPTRCSCAAPSDQRKSPRGQDGETSLKEQLQSSTMGQCLIDSTNYRW